MSAFEHSLRAHSKSQRQTYAEYYSLLEGARGKQKVGKYFGLIFKVKSCKLSWRSLI